jgi:uncharacterized protein
MIGRVSERNILSKLTDADKSDFLAVYGRRRVGKTYLIKQHFENELFFSLTGQSSASLTQQLANFERSFSEFFPQTEFSSPNNWTEAFQLLKQAINRSRKKKKVIFIDELPWLDTPKSNFLSSLEYFWNTFASNRIDILLIVCGSAASWIINKIINNKGGLHNRITQKIRVEPFTLAECQALLEYNKIQFNPYQIAQLYMVFGGIPFYWQAIEKGKSVHQIINDLCFKNTGILQSEFKNLYTSLFLNAENHERIVRILAQKNKGLTRNELLKESKLANAGSFTRILEELIESGFIRKYHPFGKLNRESLYQLIDNYSLFYLNFIENTKLSNKDPWLVKMNSQSYHSWSGYAFEQLVFLHIPQLLSALGIAGIGVEVSSWKSKKSENGAQIDLVLDRADGVVNLIEVKFGQTEYEITKSYEQNIRNKVSVFKNENKLNKAVFVGFVTVYGLKENMYFYSVQHNIKLNDLFQF